MSFPPSVVGDEFPARDCDEIVNPVSLAVVDEGEPPADAPVLAPCLGLNQGPDAGIRSNKRVFSRSGTIFRPFPRAKGKPPRGHLNVIERF